MGKELQMPLKKPEDSSLWCDTLAEAESKDLFLQLVNYSQDASSMPCADPKDSVMYVVTELATCSLKDYLDRRKSRGKKLSKDTVYDIAKAAILVSAGLHSKGFVHLDLKPENFMFFGSRMKLIDVDGCVKLGTVVSVTDSSLSFSPFYCAPEWAEFLRASKDSKIEVSPCLDVWSIGMTICEIITFEPILREAFVGVKRNSLPLKQDVRRWMDYLAAVNAVPIPESFQTFDSKLYDLLVNSLLSCDIGQRSSLAQALSHRYFEGGDVSKKAQSIPLVRQPSILNAAYAAEA